MMHQDIYLSVVLRNILSEPIFILFEDDIFTNVYICHFAYSTKKFGSVDKRSCLYKVRDIETILLTTLKVYCIT